MVVFGSWENVGMEFETFVNGNKFFFFFFFGLKKLSCLVTEKKWVIINWG